MRKRVFFAALVLNAVLAGCAQATATPATEAVAATDPVAATETAAPSVTPVPTDVLPAATPVSTATPEPTDVPEPFAITSPAFEHEAAIPERYTCDGDDSSPALAWTVPPAGTQSFAVICDDPDAPGGIWVHWVAYNIPADVRSLPEAVTGDVALSGGVHGENSWGRTGYGGPCPPSGTHRYYFTLYALDTTLDLKPGATKAELLDTLEGHVLEAVELMGTYARK